MSKRLSNLLFLVATMIWGFAFIAQKQASVVPAFTVGALRSILAAVFLLLIIPLTDKLTKNGRKLFTKTKPLDFNRHELIGGAVLGVIITVATAFQQVGLEETDAGKAAFITVLYVVMVPIISALLGKRPQMSSIVGVCLAILGFYFLCIKPGIGIEKHDLLVLVCALIFSFHIIAVDRLSPKCDGVRMSCVQFAVAFLLNGVLALIFDGKTPLTLIISMIPSFLFLGIMSSGIAYTLQIIGQKYVDPTVASIILSLESVFGVIGAAIILGEKMSGREYIGCGIVFLAVLVSQIDFKELIKKAKSKE